MIRHLSAAALTLAAAALVFACSDNALTVQPVSLCRCKADELCINDQCVPATDALVLPPGDTVQTTCDARIVAINELRHAGTSRPDFVELRGPAGTDLSGYQLRAYDLTGAGVTNVVLTGQIDESGLWVGAFGDGLEATPEAVLGLTGLPSPNGSLVLFDCADVQLDAVAWSDDAPGFASRGEGDPAAATSADQSLARCPGAFDRIDGDDNATDFFADAASPGDENTRVAGQRRCVPCDVSALDGHVWLGEVLYDPAGADADATAFVEVRGDAGLDLSEVQLEVWNELQRRWQAVGALTGNIDESGFHLVAEDDTVAGARQLLSGVDADNFAGGVRLLTCGAFVLDAVVYGAVADLDATGLDELSPDAPDGASLARCPDSAPKSAAGPFGVAPPSPGATNVCP